MAAALSSVASRAIDAVLGELQAAGIDAQRDAGAFYPQPVGVLVGLPTLAGRGLATRTFTIPVQVVSGDPLNSMLAVDRLYALADDVALAVRADTYSPSSWRSTANAEPLPTVEVVATVTVTEEE